MWFQHPDIPPYSRTAGPVPEAGDHHHRRGGGADCRSAYGDNGGSGGDGEADGGRGEKEGEDGTTSYGGDSSGDNGGSEGGSSGSGVRGDRDGGSMWHTTKHSVGGRRKGDTRHGKPRAATIPASGRNDEEAVEELHTRE